MNHADHVALIRGGVESGSVETREPSATPQVWADLGSGGGAFTLALADLLAPSDSIHSIDRDHGALRSQERAMAQQFPAITLETHRADFTKRLALPPLDGIVMANSLHFVKEKRATLTLVRSYLRPGGRFVLVEYNVDRGNHWVPHPLTFDAWPSLARECGFIDTRPLATVPSRFLGEIFAALSIT
jgi:trans-aconitate methyltransferase